MSQAKNGMIATRATTGMMSASNDMDEGISRLELRSSRACPGLGLRIASGERLAR